MANFRLSKFTNLSNFSKFSISSFSFTCPTHYAILISLVVLLMCIGHHYMHGSSMSPSQLSNPGGSLGSSKSRLLCLVFALLLYVCGSILGTPICRNKLELCSIPLSSIPSSPFSPTFLALLFYLLCKGMFDLHIRFCESIFKIFVPSVIDEVVVHVHWS